MQLLNRHLLLWSVWALDNLRTRASSTWPSMSTKNETVTVASPRASSGKKSYCGVILLSSRARLTCFRPTKAAYSGLSSQRRICRSFRPWDELSGFESTLCCTSGGGIPPAHAHSTNVATIAGKCLRTNCRKPPRPLRWQSVHRLQSFLSSLLARQTRRGRTGFQTECRARSRQRVRQP